MSIRTTVTLDDDVLEKLRRESRARGGSFRQVLNDLLRLALTTSGQGPTHRKFKVKPFNMGYRPGLNYDDVEGLIEFGEGSDHR